MSEFNWRPKITDKLMPCPFCGGSAHHQVSSGIDFVRCIKCNASLTEGKKSSLIVLFGKWNTRAVPKVKPLEWDKNGEFTINGAVDYAINHDLDDENRHIYRFAVYREEEVAYGYYDFDNSLVFPHRHLAQKAAQSHYEKLILSALEEQEDG